MPPGHRSRQQFAVLRWVGITEHSDASSFGAAKEQATAILKAAIYEIKLDDAHDEAVASPILAVHELKQIEAVLTAFQMAMAEGQLNVLGHEEGLEAEAEIKVLDSQYHSPKPKRVIVRAALRSLGDILRAGLGGAIGVGLVAAVEKAASVIR